MTSRIFAEQIIQKIGRDEDLEDIIEMIDELAHERAHARGRNENNVDYIFSGGVLCAFFEPLKLPDFTRKATDFRQSYKGISVNKELKNKFRQSFTPEVIGVQTIQEAINIGFDNLFRN